MSDIHWACDKLSASSVSIVVSIINKTSKYTLEQAENCLLSGSIVTYLEIPKESLEKVRKDTLRVLTA